MRTTPLSVSGTSLVATVLMALLSTAGHAAAGDWSNWRGPTQDGAAEPGEYPDTLSLDKNLLWRAPLPGPGSSTPILSGDHLYVTCVADGQNQVVAYALDGQELWRVAAGAARDGKHRVASGANSSPVTDGRRLVAYFKSGDLVCLDLTTGGAPSEPLWSKNLQAEFGKDTLWWDLGSSPAVTGAGPNGAVVVPIMQDDLGLLVCYDLLTGEPRWKTKRWYPTAPESGQSYGTPLVVQRDGRECVITFGGNHLTGHDAATGDQLWEAGGFNPQDKGQWRVIASPVVADGAVVTPFGRGDFLAAHRLDNLAAADAKPLWEQSFPGSDVPTPTVGDGKVYLLNDRGRVSCVDLATGQLTWNTRLPKSRQRYFASPTLAGDKLYLVREDGHVLVARVGEALQILSELDLNEPAVATPVLQAGRVYLRSREALYCFGE